MVGFGPQKDMIHRLKQLECIKGILSSFQQVNEIGINVSLFYLLGLLFNLSLFRFWIYWHVTSNCSI